MMEVWVIKVVPTGWDSWQDENEAWIDSVWTTREAAETYATQLRKDIGESNHIRVLGQYPVQGK